MKHILTFLILLCSIVAHAQEETAVQATNPTSLKWQKVRTNHFNILFPKGFEEQAQRMANTLELIYEPEAKTMGAKPKRISILLQNQSSISNAFVTLAPRRSEFYTMQPQNYNFIGNNEWLNLLSSHEYRHIVQYQASIVGFNKLLYYAFGQSFLSVSAFQQVPQWFWEGDAVATETAFTKSGRGRIPYFDMLFRTNLMEGRTFNYDKQYLRSYKHNIPDHYVFGYHMASYVRKRSDDPFIWNKITRLSWSVPPVPLFFESSVKIKTGTRLGKIYREMADTLRAGWQKELNELKLTEFTTVSKRKSKEYLDYSFPQPQKDGSVIAIKDGIGTIATVVALQNGREKKEFVMGPYNESGMLSAVDGKIVWNEYRYDPRWRVKNYSIVMGYDVKQNRKYTHSEKTRYGSAAISPDAVSIATVESTTDYKVRLVVIDYHTHEVVRAFDNPENFMITMPRWSADGKSIIAIRLLKDSKVVSKFDLATGSITDIMNAGDENVGHPVQFNQYLFYNSPYSGIDNIYALDTSTGKKYQVTSSKYGAFNPAMSFDGTTIYYNDQTRDGLDVVSAPFKPETWTPIENVKVPAKHFYDHLVAQENHPDIMRDVPSQQFPVTKYNRAASMLNIHSWGPFVGSDYTQVDVGVYSRNLLGTTIINAGYLFDINERTGTYHAGLSYQGLYPILDFSLLGGERQTTSSINGVDLKFRWKENTVTGGVRLPFLLTSSKYNRTLTVKNNISVTEVNDFRTERSRNGLRILPDLAGRLVPAFGDTTYLFSNQVSNGTLVYNTFVVSFSNYLKTSRRDFNPKWAQIVDLELYNTIAGDFKGKQVSIRSAFYFPGLFKHHSILLRGGYQYTPLSTALDRYTFRNRIVRPRGLSFPTHNQFISGSANYALPVWYPDIRLGPVVNIQRLRVNAFYDGGFGSGENYFYPPTGPVLYNRPNDTYSSVGAEFTVDVNVIRLLPQLDLGVRVLYTNPTTPGVRKPVVEFLLGTLNL